MPDDRRPLVDSIAASALQREGPSRDAYLAEACGEDTALRDEVRAVLSGAAAFLESRAFDVAPAPLAAGNRLGPYRWYGHWAPAGWARCTGRATPGSGARSRSRSCRRTSTPTRTRARFEREARPLPA